jgi:HTH-type transcriptional regulator / antitoxin HigA
MSQAELAERMGRPKKTINEIARGKAELTPETALQLERVLAVSAELWLGLERNYRAFLARQAEETKFQQFTEWIKGFPTREMVALGWIKPVRGDTAILRELLSFFGAATPQACDDVNAGMVPAFRRSMKVQANVGAIAAWLRRGEIEARGVVCAAFDRDTFLACLPRVRELTEADPDVIQERTRAICSLAGVAVVFVPGTKRMTASGATRWLSRDKACIQLSLRHKTDDHLWFTFFHEAAHVVLHRGLGFLDWEDSGSDSSAREDEANRFARDQLVPPDAFHAFLAAHGRELNRDVVRRFAHSIGIAPGIVVGRLQHDKVIHHSEFLDLKQWFAWNPAEKSDE